MNKSLPITFTPEEAEAVLELVEAARKSVKFCPAEEDHGKPEDCRIYGCIELRNALAKWDAHYKE